ncbi:carbohydrate-binding protein [Streptomyces sp. AS58]|uniref:Carbohydrate-binding protein n=1 Tax=Streptomyces cadmiisoli TaxID=2184053 RepID=A0A2Z4J2J7_9ACTN|nr:MULTISPECIES: CBM35 domain-containing protein [Streptomyces]AWW38928.1 carbohydrate-binding protein [Streptomyces cadmiisoli]KOV53657.1 carbohydrate-binding protein [Streptomyces sp. AS58]
MTPGNNGASTPEDDDPFGYLYADGQANGAQPPSGGYGYPNSVSRVRTVGERPYGQQQPYGQQAVPPQQGAYGQPNAHYAAPESFSGGTTAVHQQPAHGGGGGRGRGPNTKGLLIGAIAVVAAVVIGIGVAMLGGDDDNAAGDDQPSPTAPADQSAESSPSAESSVGPEEELPTIDAKALQLGPPAQTASDVKGAKAEGGVYVGGFNSPGASVTWTVNGIPKSGKYTLYVGYGVPGKDANATLTINGTASNTPVNLKNYAGAAEGDYEKGWTRTYNYIQLNKGTNTIKISCEQGNQCDANLDQVWLVKGWVKS